MPIPRKKEEEYKQPTLGSWQSYIFLGLVATAATGVMIGRGGFKMNRNLNVMQQFVSSHSDKFGKLVQHTPPSTHKNKIFQENIKNIVETAQKIADKEIIDPSNTKHSYPNPTFPSTSFHSPSQKKRQLISTKANDSNQLNQSNESDDNASKNT